jgi:hypothetical protein
MGRLTHPNDRTNYSNMKPTMQSIDNKNSARLNFRRLPVTDFNYHSVTLDGYNGRCARTRGPSFHTLSRDYFGAEANRDFLTEAIVFASILATAALPLLNGAQAVMHLIRTINGV